VRGGSTFDPFLFYFIFTLCLICLGSTPAATVGVTAVLSLEETDEDTDSEGEEVAAAQLAVAEAARRVAAEAAAAEEEVP